MAYAEWWSQEGVYVDLIVADCEAGQKLMTRTREAYITNRAPFDRTDRAIEILETEFQASPALFSLQRIATVLKGTGRDIEIAELQDEPCACAALYPDLRGSRSPFTEVQ